MAVCAGTISSLLRAAPAGAESTALSFSSRTRRIKVGTDELGAGLDLMARDGLGQLAKVSDAERRGQEKERRRQDAEEVLLKGDGEVEVVAT